MKALKALVRRLAVLVAAEDDYVPTANAWTLESVRAAVQGA
jgi:hypothetical protein